MAGGKNRCTNRKMAHGERGVAHRRLACGTRVLIVNPRTSQVGLATVVDRGPYGAVADGEWVIKRTPSDPGIWRGCLDVSRQVAEDIGSNGFEKVFYIPLVQ